MELHGWDFFWNYPLTLSHPGPRFGPTRTPTKGKPMADSPAATAAKPAAPPLTRLTPDAARLEGIRYARENRHSSYTAAVSEFQSKHGERELIWFEAGYYDASCGWA